MLIYFSLEVIKETVYPEDEQSILFKMSIPLVSSYISNSCIGIRYGKAVLCVVQIVCFVSVK